MGNLSERVLGIRISLRKAVVGYVLLFCAFIVYLYAQHETHKGLMGQKERELTVPNRHFYTGKMMSSPSTSFDGELNVGVAQAMAQFLWKEYGAPRQVYYEIVNGKCRFLHRGSEGMIEQWRGGIIRIHLWSPTHISDTYVCQHKVFVSDIRPLGWLFAGELEKEFLQLFEQALGDIDAFYACEPEHVRVEEIFMDYKMVKCE